ncbi:prosaposin-like isoform X2 [Pempheris klunzingeri]|uniref:prosaposin-like isoform X2 n=1 Tax=Pempheris klunzingeri TaxID=3127111 RepID=UPI00397FB50B
MTSLQTALLLLICCASAFNDDGVQLAPDAPTATGDICQDCTHIFELLADLFSSADLQKRIQDAVERLCDHLPGPAGTAKLCREEVEKMLPAAISFVTAAVKPAEACKAMGLCGSCDRQDKMLRLFVQEALQAAGTPEDGQPTTQCSFCIFLVKTLEDLLPKERTEGAVIQLLEEICHILPPSYRAQCEAIIDKFGKTVLDAILSYATPQAVCALVQLCKGQEAPPGGRSASPLEPCAEDAFRCRDIRTALRRCSTVRGSSGNRSSTARSEPVPPPPPAA